VARRRGERFGAVERGETMLESWPTPEKLEEMTRMPHAWLEATAAESRIRGVAGFEVPTAAGVFGVIASARGVTSVLFPGFDDSEIAGRLSRHGLLWSTTGRQRALEAGIELQGYLAGEIKAFSTPVDLCHLTPFQRDVYGALVEVSYGATVTYGDLARLAGHPNKARAVGLAMHRNPMPIFVPCHRVVQAGGRLGGWSGPSGWKETLLALEGAAPQEPIVSVGRVAKPHRRSLQTRRTR
jgi:methylated-DNA-[protein]-cysteine S-methyltransferase